MLQWGGVEWVQAEWILKQFSTTATPLLSSPGRRGSLKLAKEWWNQDTFQHGKCKRIYKKRNTQHSKLMTYHIYGTWSPNGLKNGILRLIMKLELWEDSRSITIFSSHIRDKKDHHLEPATELLQGTGNALNFNITLTYGKWIEEHNWTLSGVCDPYIKSHSLILNSEFGRRNCYSFGIFFSMRDFSQNSVTIGKKLIIQKDLALLQIGTNFWAWWVNEIDLLKTILLSTPLKKTTKQDSISTD